MIACCATCESPLFPQGMRAGDEAALGWPVCVNEACPAYNEPRSSVAWRESPAEGTP